MEISKFFCETTSYIGTQAPPHAETTFQCDNIAKSAYTLLHMGCTYCAPFLGFEHEAAVGGPRVPPDQMSPQTWS